MLISIKLYIFTDFLAAGADAIDITLHVKISFLRNGKNPKKILHDVLSILILNSYWMRFLRYAELSMSW